MPCCIHKVIILQVYKVRMSPSGLFSGRWWGEGQHHLGCLCTLWSPSCGCHEQTWVGHMQAGDVPDVPAWSCMLDNRVIQVQRMPRTRLGTCPSRSQPCHEWPLLASQTSLWDLSNWAVDAMTDRPVQSTSVSPKLGELLEHAWMGVPICASKMASWKSDVPALAWPGIGSLCSVSSIPKKFS
jgi:hypothetical protein